MIRNNPAWEKSAILRLGGKLTTLLLICLQAHTGKGQTDIHTHIPACIACMHTYVHAHIHTHIRTCIHAYIHTYIRPFIYLEKIHTHPSIHTCIHPFLNSMRTCIHRCHPYEHIFTDVYICLFLCVYIYGTPPLSYLPFRGFFGAH